MNFCLQHSWSQWSWLISLGAQHPKRCANHARQRVTSFGMYLIILLMHSWYRLAKHWLYRSFNVLTGGLRCWQIFPGMWPWQCLIFYLWMIDWSWLYKGVHGGTWLWHIARQWQWHFQDRKCLEWVPWDGGWWTEEQKRQQLCRNYGLLQTLYWRSLDLQMSLSVFKTVQHISEPTQVRQAASKFESDPTMKTCDQATQNSAKPYSGGKHWSSNFDDVNQELFHISLSRLGKEAEVLEEHSPVSCPVVFQICRFLGILGSTILEGEISPAWSAWPSQL